MAITFPGSASNALGRTTSLAATAFTVVAFIRPRTGSTGIRTIWSWKNSGSAEEHRFALDATDKLVDYHNGSARAQATLALTLGSEYFVALTVSGSTITVISALVSTNAALVTSTGTRTTGAGAADLMMIGESQAGEYFDGEIQSVRLYDSLLGTNDLASEQKRQIPRRGDVWAWYRLLDNDNDKYWDRSGNGRDLSEQGAGSGRSTGLNVGPGYNPRTARVWKIQPTVYGTGAFSTAVGTVAVVASPIVTATVAATTSFSVAVAASPIVTSDAAVTTAATVAVVASPIVTSDVAFTTSASVAVAASPAVAGEIGVSTTVAVVASGGTPDVAEVAFSTAVPTVAVVARPVVSSTVAFTTPSASISAAGGPLPADGEVAFTTSLATVEITAVLPVNATVAFTTSVSVRLSTPRVTQFDIVNLALKRIGINPGISSLTDGSQEADLAVMLWIPSLESVLAMFPWPFATRRAALNEATGVTRTGWTYVYEYPDDCVVARYIHTGLNAPASEFRIPFAVEYPDTGDLPVLGCDLPDAELVYTCRVTNTALFTPPFVDAFAWFLAAEMAFPLSVRTDLRDQAAKMWEMMKGRAEAAAMTEGHETIPNTGSITVRGVY